MKKNLRSILSISLIVATGEGTSVFANPINSTQADSNNRLQTSELLVKDLRDFQVKIIPETPLETANSEIPQTTDTEKCLSDQLPSPQPIALDTPEIEIPVTTTRSLLKCTETKTEQQPEIAQDAPAGTEIEQTAPEEVPTTSPTNEQTPETEPTPQSERTPATGGDLAAQSQNPIADLISLPFQNNLNFGSGPRERLQYILNVQPVIPIQLSEDWLLVSRTVVPFINQPKPIDDTTFGIGDINPQFFFVPTSDNEELTDRIRADYCSTHCLRYRNRFRKMGFRPDRGNRLDTWQDRRWCFSQPYLVSCQRSSPKKDRLYLHRALFQLQPTRWMVSNHRTLYYG